MSERIYITVSDDFYAMLKKYKAWRGHKSMSAAVAELAALGASNMVKNVPPIRASWGGTRKGDEWEQKIDREMDRLSLTLSGLDPDLLDLLDEDE